MVQAIAMSTTTALVAARAGQARVSRAKSVVARCVIPHDINPRLQDMTIQPLFSRDRRDVGSASASKPRATPRSFAFRRGS